MTSPIDVPPLGAQAPGWWVSQEASMLCSTIPGGVSMQIPAPMKTCVLNKDVAQLLSSNTDIWATHVLVAVWVQVHSVHARVSCISPKNTCLSG
jgi:hypothetical protein